MARARLPVACLLVAGCGRIGFDGLASDAPPANGGFLGDPRCPPDVILCEDFEAAQIDASRWTADLSNATAEIDATRAARGAHSLHVNGATTSTVHAQLIHGEPSLPVPVYVRAFVYATALAPSSTETIAWVFNSTDDGVQIEPFMGSWSFDGWGTSGAHRYGSTALPLDRWVCMEWSVGATTMSLWQDDAATDLQGVAWTMPSATNKVAVGLQYHSPSPTPIDVWIDEVIIDDAPIGCAK